MTETVSSKNNSYIFVIVIVIMSVLALTTTTTIVLLRPEQDNVPIISQIFLFSATITASILTFLKAEQASNQARETHDVVNSRLDQFIENADIAARAEGKAEGVVEGREAAENRTDEIKKMENK